MFKELKETQIKYSIKTVRQFKGHTGPCSAVITSSPLRLSVHLHLHQRTKWVSGSWIMGHHF